MPFETVQCFFALAIGFAFAGTEHNASQRRAAAAITSLINR